MGKPNQTSDRQSRVEQDSIKPALTSSVLPMLGLIVADASLLRFSANREAVAILTHPGPPESLATAFDKKIRRALLGVWQRPSNKNAAYVAIQFESGRQTYFGRAFLLSEEPASNGSGAMVVIILEPRSSGSLPIVQISQRFRLARREQEALTLLLEGLSNKEIADRMRVSQNTVKAFVRTIMLKMGVTNRGGIAAKVLDIVSSSQQVAPDT